MPLPVQFQLGETLVLRKPHPCGGSTWEVVRLGADIGIRCLTCRRRVLVPRSKLEKQVRHRELARPPNSS
ncbi:MAG: DUF951 domain-containing protein [Chloroflexi bacterium]|nr:DUF951 domain-containing protein [Chloroflexota bacterium]